MSTYLLAVFRPMLTVIKASQQIKEAIESLEDEDDEDESSMMA
jgi:hypothetical protein